jgi:hypothetical protein
MPHVKGETPPDANPVRRRLLTIARLLKSEHEDATLALVERAFGLDAGVLKDYVKRKSISTGLATRLVEGQEAAGLTGLTTDWLLSQRGEPPQKVGVMAPGGPATPRMVVSGGPELAYSGGTAGEQLATGVVAMLREAVARLITDTLAQDEASNTVAGRLALAKELRAFAKGLSRNVHVDVADILDAADALEEGRLT